MSSKLLTIGIFTDTYFPHLNGVTTSVDSLVRELRKKNHRVVIVAPSIDDYKDTDPDVIRIPSFKVLSNAPQVRFPLLIPDSRYKQAFIQDFDLIHAHGNGVFSLLGHRVARMKRIPYILTFHTLFTEYTHYLFNGKLVNPSFMKSFLAFFAQMCDGILTPSEKMKKKLLSYGIDKEITVISNIIDTKRFHATAKKSGVLHKQFSIPVESLILLSTGRLEKEKNFSFVLKAFKKVLEQCPNTHLVLVGSGNEEAELKQLAQAIDIGQYVHFTGRVDAKDMPKVYQDSDIFVYASTSEVQGMVFLEACATGLPFVLVKDTAYQYVVEDGVNGFTPPLIEKEFVSSLTKLCKDDTLRHQFSKNSYELIEKHFAPSKLADQFIGYYQKILVEYSENHVTPRLHLHSQLFDRVNKSIRKVDSILKKL